MDCRKWFEGWCIGAECRSERDPHSRTASANFRPGNLTVRCGDRDASHLESEALAFVAGYLAFYDNVTAGPTVSRFGWWPCCSPLFRWLSCRVCRPPGQYPADLSACDG